MTKEVEVGDEFTGKVVKTTTFGAFVELSKGTDGLLHISNVARSRGSTTVEEVLNKGDEVEVRVVEVDRERGRIGLRLADDPEIAGKTAEELAAVGTGDGGGGGARRRPRRPWPRRRRRPRRTRRRPRRARLGPPASRRDRDPDARLARRARPLHDARLGRPGRDGGDALRPLRVARVLDRHRLAVWSPRREAGLSHLLEHLLFKGTDRYESVEIDQIFDGMGAELNAGTGKETTSVYARVIDEHLARGVRRDGRHGLPPGAARPRVRARGDPRGDRDVRGRPAGEGLRRARRGRLRRAPAGSRDHRPRRVIAATPATGLAALPRRALRARELVMAAAGLGRARRVRASW